MFRDGTSEEIVLRGLDEFNTHYVPFCKLEFLPNPENWLSGSKWLENWKDRGKTQRMRSRNGGSNAGTSIKGGGTYSRLADQLSELE